MRKLILLIGLIAILGLVGCAAVQKTKTVSTTTEGIEDDLEDIDTDVEVDQEDETTSDDETTTTSNQPVTPPISQEELDQLKADLEALETEDLGGLSE